jgi:hypothetical protein
MRSIHRALAIATIAVALCGSVSEAQTRSETIERRFERQKQRIERALRSGQLTRQEVRRLAAAQRQIAAAERRVLRDGRLAARERARLRAMLDRQSYRIWRYSHNRPRPLVY